MWGVISIGGIIMLLLSPVFYHLWIGDKVHIPFNLSLMLLIYFITYNFGGAFNLFINGVGKVKLQMYSSLIGAILFIFVAVFSIKYFNLGIVGLVFASIVSNFYGVILAPIQYKKIIQYKDSGIWSR